MTRPVVKIQFIVNPQARRVTLQKRKAGLLKKINELKILCDVDTCMIMYEQEGAPPEVWPSHSEAHRVIQKVQDSKSPWWTSKSVINDEDILNKSIENAEKELKRQKEKNVRSLMAICLSDKSMVEELNQEELKGLCAAVDSQLELIDEKIKEKASEKGKEKLFYNFF